MRNIEYMGLGFTIGVLALGVLVMIAIFTPGETVPQPSLRGLLLAILVSILCLIGLFAYSWFYLPLPHRVVLSSMRWSRIITFVIATPTYFTTQFKLFLDWNTKNLPMIRVESLPEPASAWVSGVMCIAMVLITYLLNYQYSQCYKEFHDYRGVQPRSARFVIMRAPRK